MGDMKTTILIANSKFNGISVCVCQIETLGIKGLNKSNYKGCFKNYETRAVARWGVGNAPTTNHFYPPRQFLKLNKAFRENALNQWR